MRKMKIKDLPKDFNLVGCKLGKQYIYSGWNKGFWLSDEPRNSDKGSGQLHPVFFKSFDDIKEWDIEVPLGHVPLKQALKE